MEAEIKDLDSRLTQTLIGLGTTRRYSPDQQIFAEGDMATFLPVVLRGRVKMLRHPTPGKEVIIGIFEEGEMFAIPPALDGKSFPATAVAMDEAQVLFVPRDRFLSLLKESSEFSSVVLNRMCGILRDRSKTVQILSAPSAEQRVAAVLVKYAEAENTNGTPVEIKLRRQDIAEMTGLTTESTIRAIRRLGEKNIIRIVRRKIVLDGVATINKLRSL